MLCCALSLSVLTFILARKYVELACGLLLISDLPSGKRAGLWGLPSTVLEGSSGWVCVSMVECLVRQRGVVIWVVSAGLASTSIVRTDGGKMETGERRERERGSVMCHVWISFFDTSKISWGKNQVIQLPNDPLCMDVTLLQGPFSSTDLKLAIKPKRNFRFFLAS